MDLSQLINDGWARHDSQTSEVAAQLEAVSAQVDEEHAVAYQRLVNHTVGEHLNDWRRAARIAEVITSRCPLPDVYLHAYVAATACADTANAATWHARFAELSAADNSLVKLRTSIHAAKALLGSGASAPGDEHFATALQLIDSHDSTPDLYTLPTRELAITFNNIAGDLLEVPDKSAALCAIQQTAAERALHLWRNAGTWEHEERAFYLLANVALDQARPAEAIALCESAFEIINRNGGEDVDSAFLHLAMAQAHQQLDDAVACKKCLSSADQLAASWPDEGLRAWYSSERAAAFGDNAT